MNDLSAACRIKASRTAERSRARRLPAMLTLVLGLFLVVQGLLALSEREQRLRASDEWAWDKTAEIASALSGQLRGVSAIARELAAGLQEPACHACDIERVIRRVVFNHTGFKSLGAAFSPFESGTGLRLYAPFVRGDSSAGRVERLDSYYDYLSTSTGAVTLSASGQASAGLGSSSERWYEEALHSGAGWMAPRFEAALSDHVLRYTVPLDHGRDEPKGIAFVDVGLDWLSEVIEAYDLGDNNYLVVLDAERRVLYHSMRGQRVIVDGLGQPFDADLLEQYRGRRTSDNELTGERAWLQAFPVGSAGWTVLTSISVDSVDQYARGAVTPPAALLLRGPVSWIFWIVGFLLAAYACLRARRRRTTRRLLWVDSAVYTALFVGGILTVWLCEYGADTRMADKSLVLSNQAVLNDFKKDYAILSLRSHRAAPVYIPVGLFVQSIEFVSATNVNLTGYIWHRYLEGQGMDLTAGTVFPEAIHTEIKEAYTETIGGEVIKGWYFETTLRERFDPSRFPFDRQSVWVRLWHEKLAENIVLVPDFRSYDSLHSRSLPGIEKDFVLSGWTLYQSYFDMRINHYNTSFGRSGYASGDAMPELYFNIELSRNFLSPFIAHLFPLFVVLLMLYAIVVTMSHDQQRKELLGSDVSTVVASCSALFFVALIAHVQMRRELAANSVVYLEYFYLIAYFFVLLITMNAVLFSWKIPVRFVQFHDNLLPKLVYWPVLLGGLFLCTVLIFL